MSRGSRRLGRERLVLPHAFPDAWVDYPTEPSHITFMALSKKKATTIALDPEADHSLHARRVSGECRDPSSSGSSSRSCSNSTDAIPSREVRG